MQSTDDRPPPEPTGSHAGHAPAPRAALDSPLPATGAAAGQLDGHSLPSTPVAAAPHAGHVMTAPAAAADHSGHDMSRGMGHDMSDPAMAAAMEREMRTRFLWALALTIPTILFSPIPTNIFGLSIPTPIPADIIMLLLSTPIVFWCGSIFLTGAWSALRTRQLNMSVLIATGVLAAWGASLLLTLLREPDSYYEAAAMLVTFVLFGHWMEMRARRGTTDSLNALLNLVPQTATVVRDGAEIDLPVAEVVVGDRVIIRPGDKIPVDGVVASGSTTVDEALLTGESLPVDKLLGDPLTGGSINLTGRVDMTATGVGADTALARIVDLVRSAQASKAPGQRLADRAAQYLVIVALGSGLITFVLWLTWGQAPFLVALTFAISAIVIACPDALGLATPTAVAVGTGVGAEHNILIKDAATLEGIARVDTVVFDKTGTLTEGTPAVTDVVALDGNEARLLALLAAAEAGSTHPVAQAIQRHAAATVTAPLQVLDFLSTAGQGVEASVDGRRVATGNPRLMQRLGIDITSLEARAAELASAGRTPLFIAIDGRAAGLVAVADAIRPSAAAALERLHGQGVAVVMLTGDNARTAGAVSRELRIDRVLADVPPAGKADAVALLQAEGHVVAMVGDGVNDAPALARADIGFAIGAGTDVAVETADVVLMRSDPSDVSRAITLSRATLRTMKQNLFWASIYNLLAIPIAAGVLYPAFGISLRPEWAALLMSASSIIVALNAVALRRVSRQLA